MCKIFQSIIFYKISIKSVLGYCSKYIYIMRPLTKQQPMWEYNQVNPKLLFLLFFIISSSSIFATI